MKVELRPLLDFGLSEAVVLMNLGFSDYFVPIHLSLAAFLTMARSESIDLTESRVIAFDGEGVGIALIARRGWTSRLAAMSVVPDARGQGAGRAAMELLLSEARARADRAMVLEVIASNVPAVCLYRSIGFQVERTLLGYVGSVAEGENPAPDTLEELDVREAARWVSMYGLPDLPWQLSGESLAQAGPPNLAYRLGDACLVISNPQAERVALRSIVVRPEARRQKQATRLVQAVAARHPNRRWLISPVFPEEMRGFFESIGLTQEELSQLQMRIPFHGT